MKVNGKMGRCTAKEFLLGQKAKGVGETLILRPRLVVWDINMKVNLQMGKSTAVFGESKHDWYHSQSGKKDRLCRIDY